jgi:hypothetical protein
MSGFRLKDLIAGLVALALLTAIAVPVVKHRRFRADVAEMMSRGRAISADKWLLFNWDIEDYGAVLRQRYVPSTNYSTSTEYFRDKVTSGLFSPAYMYEFGGAGVPEFRGTNPVEFTAANNAWCIAADLPDSIPEKTPVMFTRNLQARYASAVVDAPMSDEKPFGRQGFVIFNGDGSCSFVRDRDRPKFFDTPIQATNKILRP